MSGWYICPCKSCLKHVFIHFVCNSRNALREAGPLTSYYTRKQVSTLLLKMHFHIALNWFCPVQWALGVLAWAGDWARWSPDIPSNRKCSALLCLGMIFCCFPRYLARDDAYLKFCPVLDNLKCCVKFQRPRFTVVCVSVHFSICMNYCLSYIARHMNTERGVLK